MLRIVVALLSIIATHASLWSSVVSGLEEYVRLPRSESVVNVIITPQGCPVGASAPSLSSLRPKPGVNGSVDVTATLRCLMYFSAQDCGATNATARTRLLLVPIPPIRNEQLLLQLPLPAPTLAGTQVTVFAQGMCDAVIAGLGSDKLSTLWNKAIPLSGLEIRTWRRRVSIAVQVVRRTSLLPVPLLDASTSSVGTVQSSKLLSGQGRFVASGSPQQLTTHFTTLRVSPQTDWEGVLTVCVAVYSPSSWLSTDISGLLDSSCSKVGTTTWAFRQINITVHAPQPARILRNSSTTAVIAVRGANAIALPSLGFVEDPDTETASGYNLCITVTAGRVWTAEMWVNTSTCLDNIPYARVQRLLASLQYQAQQDLVAFDPTQNTTVTALRLPVSVGLTVQAVTTARRLRFRVQANSSLTGHSLATFALGLEVSLVCPPAFIVRLGGPAGCANATHCLAQFSNQLGCSPAVLTVAFVHNTHVDVEFLLAREQAAPLANALMSLAATGQLRGWGNATAVHIIAASLQTPITSSHISKATTDDGRQLLHLLWLLLGAVLVIAAIGYVVWRQRRNRVQATGPTNLIAVNSQPQDLYQRNSAAPGVSRGSIAAPIPDQHHDRAELLSPVVEVPVPDPVQT
eukprot:TRINITY_DN2085_c0_g1_i1.p1 TRINITY_DN2085_c0_g1~~TRINITY_DN2085_c0_g1_i1.p1  ORF type:complete len:632 (-),score=82.32 TRINITY_DN2085_c0_g1_i1:16-1911(-)